ncbi:carbamoyltransferase [Geodermatophilus amargosae]|uniref:Carbamoyltransferase n=1 Tax=Geodermatophilus amargosae TaxID=1296565 RepID=A0A1I7CW46_9ACTN|nr:carbamoyltransferase C-terminal domain-containing protein [Geodermatophilus amargosae]SFU03609.1 carbamoyltransferase [Geodermatophilus amargosae]
MIIYGVSANEHDASLAVVRGREILFASAAERYSRVKNDPHLNADLLADAMRYGPPDLVVWYEKPHLKRARKAWAGQWSDVGRTDGARYVHRFLPGVPVRYVGHHESHAAAGYFTSPFDDAVILVADAIGEWETLSAWTGQGPILRRLWSQNYPDSLGLLYSAFTQRIGLTPNEEEYILMGMAASGEPVYRDLIWQDFVERFDPPRLKLRENPHRGVRWWRPDLDRRADLAASIQAVTEDVLLGITRWLARTTGRRRLVLAGGVAMNCLANTRIAQQGLFDQIWIMPNPGDGGSSIGAALAWSRRHARWRHPYLGHAIDRPFDQAGALAALSAGDVIGVATGRAEFGPRALGNRSLFTDPRDPAARDKVNALKRREPFRPFAPMVLAEHAHEHFDLPVPTSPYMQFVAPVRHPEAFPAIVHADGTARVQTLRPADNPAIHGLLADFHARTGCPMLLNTSLNVKGEPLVNSVADADRFTARSGIRVY